MRTLALLLVLVLSTAALAQTERIELRVVATGLERPVAITHANDDRLFITLQRGTVVIYDGTRILPTPFLDIRSIVRSSGSEEGLLSVAFHPRYRENGFFFVYYTNLSGDIVIARYRVTSDPDRADSASGSILLTIPHPTNSNHNGGQLQFSPDGFLYIGTGDGGAGGDPPNNAQTLTVLLGKLLRIDVDSGSPYGLPPSNPFIGMSSRRNEIWAYGLRNPWRFTFDRENGDLWIADVGQGEIEEIDLQRATSIGGENYGWKRMEGTRCFPSTANCDRANLVLPVIDYPHNPGGHCSVTGGYRYRGTEFPRLRGTYVYGDFCSGMMWGLNQAADGTWINRTLINTPIQISTFGEDVRGELYVAHYGGDLYRIVDAGPPPSGARRRAVPRR